MSTIRLLVSLSLASVAFAPVLSRPVKQAQPENRNIRWGMPATATADPKNRDNYLIARPQYVLAYSDKKKTANWVSWNLVRSDIGRVARGSFEEDTALPKGFPRIQFQTYIGSGMDRGHLCPSKDRSARRSDNDAVFLMTNIVPQSPNCNQKGWERLETYCRDLAFSGKDLYIVAGPHGQGGQGDDKQKKITIGRRAPFVTVPASLWKVILVLPNRDATPGKSARMIAVWMPNDPTVTDDWPKYRVSVAEVEKRTGLNFFPLLPADVAAALKNNVDQVKVVVPPRK